MKASEFRKLIREEVRKVIKEAAKSWDQESIKLYFKDLKKHSHLEPQTTLDGVTGKFKMIIHGMDEFSGRFTIDPANKNNLVFMVSNNSYQTAETFAAMQELDFRGYSKYKFSFKGNKFIVSLS